MMGDKNHQPCRVYLRNSTILSRNISIAHMNIEQANIILEGVLIDELDGKISDLRSCYSLIDLSIENISNAIKSLIALKNQMIENSFKDLPILLSINLDEYIERLINEGLLINRESSMKITDIYRLLGFYGVINHFETSLIDLRDKTDNLSLIIKQLIPSSDNGMLNEVLEENKVLNTYSLRYSFARVYSAWELFNGEFLTSALISTELWYRYMEFESLLDITISDPLSTP